LALSIAVIALVVSMVQPTFLARLVGRIGSGVRRSIALLATRLTAVDLAAITKAADVEDLAAPPAPLLPKTLLLVHSARALSSGRPPLPAVQAPGQQPTAGAPELAAAGHRRISAAKSNRIYVVRKDRICVVENGRKSEAMNIRLSNLCTAAIRSLS
jgi:hypothetical protein